MTPDKPPDGDLWDWGMTLARLIAGLALALLAVVAMVLAFVGAFEALREGVGWILGR